MRLMIIGDLAGQIGAASKIARDRGARITQVETIDTAIEALCNGQGADLMMIHVEEDIEKLTALLKSQRISLDVVACGVDADSEAAVTAIRSGAKEYIPLPPDEELIAAVLQAITEETQSVIYTSAAMNQLMNMVSQIAPSDASVLITGESGTGKEVIARTIHEKSKRTDKAFIAVNCAAIPENLLESELFGHEKGAFTGATNRRIGKFEEANGGTLLLDEISEMDIKLQAKLLRAIQEQEIDRVGGSSPVKVDVRILATSNRNLVEQVQRGEFREDLYYRLNVINVMLPPLRERQDDIPLLAKHFIEKYSKANGVPPRPFTDDAVEKMKSYGWPGNVRELENIMHRTVLMAQGDRIDAQAILLPQSGHAMAMPQPIATSSIPPQPASLPPTTYPASGGEQTEPVSHLVGRSVADVEKELILNTLDHCLGNRTHAANILGISIRTLRNKLKQYGASEHG
jgi:DNA-binding NtrC family response regulator